MCLLELSSPCRLPWVSPESEVTFTNALSSVTTDAVAKTETQSTAFHA